MANMKKKVATRKNSGAYGGNKKDTIDLGKEMLKRHRDAGGKVSGDSPVYGDPVPATHPGVVGFLGAASRYATPKYQKAAGKVLASADKAVKTIKGISSNIKSKRKKIKAKPVSPKKIKSIRSKVRKNDYRK